MSNFEKIYENHLVSLKIPALWRISKNNFICLDNLDLSDFSADDLFVFNKIFCENDVFHSVYDDAHPIFELNIRVYFISKQEYEISCMIVNKKKKIVLFECIKSYHSLHDVIQSLNKIHLSIPDKIEMIYSNKNYEKLDLLF